MLRADLIVALADRGDQETGLSSSIILPASLADSHLVFRTLLCGDAPLRDGYLHVTRGGVNRPGERLNNAHDLAMRCGTGHCDAFFTLGITKWTGNLYRGKAEHFIGLTAFAIDRDPGKGPSSTQEARDSIRRAGLPEPTFGTKSGRGEHFYWSFHAPWYSVKLLFHDGPKHNPSVFEHWSTPRISTSTAGNDNSFDADEPAEIDDATRELLEGPTRLGRLWRQEESITPSDSSQSGWDLELMKECNYTCRRATPRRREPTPRGAAAVPPHLQRNLGIH